MAPMMRSICDRLDLKVRLYKLDPFVGGTSAMGKRRFSLTSLKEEDEEGSTPRSSEPMHSSSEDIGVGRKEDEDEKEDESSSEDEDDDEQVRPKKAKITKGFFMKITH